MNRRVKKRLALTVCVIMIFSLLAGPLYAEELGILQAQGVLYGAVIYKATGQAAAGVKITASGTAAFNATADADGMYRMDLPAGSYTVSCEATGYNTAMSDVTVGNGAQVQLDFALTKAEPNTGTISGKITDGVTGPVIAGATVTTDTGSYSATTDFAGNFAILNVTPGSYNVSVSAANYNSLTKTVTVNNGETTTCDFALAPLSSAVDETSLVASPNAFVEASISEVSLNATIDGLVTDYSWTQVSGPKVPLTVIDATYAKADVSALQVAVDTELVFRLAVTGSDGNSSYRDVSVFVEPADMFPFLGPNVQIGGAANAVSKFTYNGSEWAIFNIGNKLCTTPIGTAKGQVYGIYSPGFINDIDLVDYAGNKYALLAAGSKGIVVVDITDPTNMVQVSNVHINYYQDGITYTEGGGSILTNNIISSVKAPVAALETDGVDLYIADSEFGIHRTALENLLGIPGPTLESDGTLKIDAEKFTMQYAGENPWGGPVDIKLYNGKLFVCLKELGLGIFDPVTLEQVGGYNLYTDTSVSEDWFTNMDVQQAVQKDPVSQDVYADDFTGMPDYRQTSYEILQVMKNNISAPTPWSDFDRYGKYYYNAQSVDIAEFNGRTIAYIAYSLGGLVAVDVTGFQNAAMGNAVRGKYLGYIPAVPANGPDEPTGTQSQSLLPYYGAGMLKDSGVIDVKIKGNYAYVTDHFAGLLVIANAGTPDVSWRGANAPYNNDTDGIPGNHWPDYEFVTSYDMSPYDPSDNESMPKWMYESPCLLVTGELNGHGNALLLMDNMSLDQAGNIDLLECSGAGGFNFVDITNLNAPAMADRYTIPAYFPTTDEIGAAADGSATQTISIGHSAGIASSGSYIYVADGPHGISAWKIIDENGYATDNIHLVANTLQDEYPEIVNGVTIYPASHASNVVYDAEHQAAWACSTTLGLRRVDTAGVEAGQGQAGNPLLIPLDPADCFEHNGQWGSVKPVQYQDHAYDCEIRGNYIYVADGSNGLTVYDSSKDPSDTDSGFLVANLGAGKKQPSLGTASGIALWTDSATGKSYAMIACGPRGVGVVDITDVKNMRLIKVFEPIKIEDGKVGAADGQAVDVKVAGDYAYFSYDSFGVVCYRLSDLIEPLPVGIAPTEVWQKNSTGQLIYDYRPAAVSQFKLQLVPGYEDWAGGAVKMDYTQVNGKLMFYVAFAEAGLLKIDYTDPANPVLQEIASTISECNDVTISNGRIYAVDGSGGLVFFK